MAYHREYSGHDSVANVGTPDQIGGSLSESIPVAHPRFGMHFLGKNMLEAVNAKQSTHLDHANGET